MELKGMMYAGGVVVTGGLTLAGFGWGIWSGNTPLLWIGGFVVLCGLFILLLRLSAISHVHDQMAHWAQLDRAGSAAVDRALNDACGLGPAVHLHCPVDGQIGVAYSWCGLVWAETWDGLILPRDDGEFLALAQDGPEPIDCAECLADFAADGGK